MLYTYYTILSLVHISTNQLFWHNLVPGIASTTGGGKQAVAYRFLKFCLAAQIRQLIPSLKAAGTDSAESGRNLEQEDHRPRKLISI
jgi:hypothetical protein